jgi:hypothetical protein
MFKMIVKPYPGRPKEAVLDAAVAALKSLGHEVESVDRGGAHPKVNFRAIVGGRRDRKSWSVSVGDYGGGGGTVANVSRLAFFGGQSKVTAVGQEIFQSMDTILA